MILDFCTSELDETLVDFDKVSILDDVITYFPGIISKSKNVSDGMHDILLTTSTIELKKQS